MEYRFIRSWIEPADGQDQKLLLSVQEVLPVSPVALGTREGISYPLGKVHPRDLHREIQIPVFPIGGGPAHTPKPEAGSVAHLGGDRDHNRPPSIRNGD